MLFFITLEIETAPHHTHDMYNWLSLTEISYKINQLVQEEKRSHVSKSPGGVGELDLGLRSILCTDFPGAMRKSSRIRMLLIT